MGLIFQILYINAMKYTYEKFQPCEECEENSKIFYEMEKTKLCPRCSLGYLSLEFEEQNLNIIKFYLTDIIFQHLKNVPKSPTEPNWSSIYDMVDKLAFKFVIADKQEQEKIQNQRIIINLIAVTNVFMFEINENCSFIENRKCLNCSKLKFHLIKTLCCQQYICFRCIMEPKLKDEKCMLCKEVLYKNKEEFGQLVKSTCLAYWKSIRQKTKDKEKYLENVTKKILTMTPKRKNKENTLWKQVKEIIERQLELNHQIPKMKFKEKYGKILSVRAKALFFSNKYQNLIVFGNIVSQLSIILVIGYGFSTSFKCAITNNALSISFVQLKSFYLNSRPITLKSRNKTYGRDHVIEKLVVSWINFSIGYYMQDSNFFEKTYCVVLNFITLYLPIYFVIFIVLRLIIFRTN